MCPDSGGGAMGVGGGYAGGDGGGGGGESGPLVSLGLGEWSGRKC